MWFIFIESFSFHDNRISLLCFQLGQFSNRYVQRRFCIHSSENHTQTHFFHKNNSEPLSSSSCHFFSVWSEEELWNEIDGCTRICQNFFAQHHFSQLRGCEFQVNKVIHPAVFQGLTFFENLNFLNFNWLFLTKWKKLVASGIHLPCLVDSVCGKLLSENATSFAFSSSLFSVYSSISEVVHSPQPHSLEHSAQDGPLPLINRFFCFVFFNHKWLIF